MMPFENSVLGEIRQACGELQADAVEMLAARRDLAQLELRLATARTTRLGFVVGACGAAALAGFVILTHVAAENLPAVAGITRGQTRLLCGAGLMLAGTGAALWAVRRFLRKYRHFEQSQAELLADLQAMQSWLERGKNTR